MGHSNCDKCGHDTKMCDCPKEPFLRCKTCGQGVNKGEAHDCPGLLTTTEHLNDRGANAMQVGGDHYKADFQHWDWVIATGMGYLEGNATKYISRWRSKNGIQDLEKASHYVTKAKEAFLAGHLVNRSGNLEQGEAHRVEADNKFFEAAKLGPIECSICRNLRIWQTAEELDLVLGLIAGIMSIAKEAKFVPPRPSATR